MKNLLLQEAVKSILCQMAVDCTLPSDMTQLDIGTVFEKAEKSLENDETYKRVCKLDKLAEFLSYDEDNEINVALENLEVQAKIDDTVMVDHVDGVQVTEQFEFTFTVRDLLQEIS